MEEENCHVRKGFKYSSKLPSSTPRVTSAEFDLRALPEEEGP